MLFSMLGTTFLSVITTIAYILLAIVVLLLVITIHEFGHYTFGKWLGFKINEFSIGFGKPIFSKTRKNGEKFSIRILPLGGYCAFAGEDEKDDDSRAFNRQKPWKRIIVLLGGVVFNFLSAIIFAFILLVSFGYDIPKVSDASKNQEYVATYNQDKEDSQKIQAFQNGDVIRKIDGKDISFVQGNSLQGLISTYSINETFVVTVQRDGATIEFKTAMFQNPNSPSSSTGVLGISHTPYKYSFLEALVSCVPVACAMAWQVLVFLFMLLTGGVALSNVAGPITTIGYIAEYSQLNIANLFIFLPFISANLAMFNILPIPALDGSRIVFTTVEWIRKKPIKPEIEAKIHMIGLFVLLAFVIFVDLYNLIR